MLLAHAITSDKQVMFSLQFDGLSHQWRRDGAKGVSTPNGAFQGAAFQGRLKYRPVCGHLNALQLSVSVHQRCSVTFKMHQIHIRPGLRPIRTLGSSPHSSQLGHRARRGGRTPQTLVPPLCLTYGLIKKFTVINFMTVLGGICFRKRNSLACSASGSINFFSVYMPLVEKILWETLSP